EAGVECAVSEPAVQRLVRVIEDARRGPDPVDCLGRLAPETFWVLEALPVGLRVRGHRGLLLTRHSGEWQWCMILELWCMRRNRADVRGAASIVLPVGLPDSGERAPPLLSTRHVGSCGGRARARPRGDRAVCLRV